MRKPEFVYVTYIETTPEKLWEALTDSAFTRQYWFDTEVRSDWKVGSPFALVMSGKVTDSGEILQADPPRRLAYTFRHELDEGMRKEGATRVTFTLEPHGNLAGTQTGDAPICGPGAIFTMSGVDPHGTAVRWDFLDIKQSEAMRGKNLFHRNEREIGKMLVINGVELILFHQSRQVREFQRHRAFVDQHADGERKPAERHHVDGLAQRRDRDETVRQRGNGEDAHWPYPHQAAAQGPGAGCRPGVPSWADTH